MIESKAVSFTESWSESDQIIIFVDGQDEGYIYNVESDGTMSPDGTAISGGVETKQTYYAFTPVSSAFTTLAEYEAATPRDDEDLLSAVAAGTSNVDFSFSHDLAALFFEMVTESSITSAKVTDGDTEYTLDLDIDGTTIYSSLFVTPQSDLSSANLVVTSATGSTTTSLKTSSFTEWSAGKYYVYRDIIIEEIIGDGTETNPFRVYTAADLAKVGSTIDGWDLDKSYKMMTNIDLEGSEENQWDPIGYTNNTEANSFTGQFDGNGYTVSGLYINTTEQFQGLFAFCKYATISNLTVEGSVTSTNSHCGGIVGMSKYTNIINCHNRADVTGTSRVGGIAGGAGGSYNSFQMIANCSNSGTIVGCDYSVSDYSDEMTMRVGGIAGTSGCYLIHHCYNVGSVSNTDPTGEAYAIASPGGDDAYEQVVSSCYYSDDCGGIDPAATSMAKSNSYMQSSAFATELNSNVSQNASAIYHYSGLIMREWEMGNNGYPTTNRNEAEVEALFSGGSGTEISPYLISSAEDLIDLAILYDVYYSDDYDYYKLTCDIDLKGSESNQWNPIGQSIQVSTDYDYMYSYNPFIGHFDGDGHTISGLYINSTERFQGLFAFCKSATIRNLTVEGSVTSTSSNCGGITGMSYFSDIINCHNRANITGTSRVGGIAGGAGAWDINTIINCSNSGTIIGNDYSDSEYSSEKTMRVGGIAGTSGGVTITNCYNVGSVSNIDPSGEAYAIAAPGGDDVLTQHVSLCYYGDDCGGIDPDATSTAYSKSYMQSSEFVGELNSNASEEAYTNYIYQYTTYLKEWEIGSNGYPTTNSVDVEPQEPQGPDMSFSGGSGTYSSPYLISSAEDLKKVESLNEYDYYYYKLTCDIDLEGSETNQWDPIGWAENSEDSNVDISEFSGYFDGDGYTISGLYINSTERFQGLFAFCYDATICNLTVEGSVTSTSANCGGIAGMSRSSILVNCHNRADITGTSRIGGITGGAGSGLGYCYILNCSNSGTIIGNDYSDSQYSSEKTMRVGGIAGTSAETIIGNCYNVGSVSNIDPSGEAYAIAAPSGDDYYFQSVSNCYYSDDCGGIDPDGTSIACSQSYMQSSEFITELNMVVSGVNEILTGQQSAAIATDWEIGDNGYPTTKH